MQLFRYFKRKFAREQAQQPHTTIAPVRSNESPLVFKNSMGLEFSVPRAQWRSHILPENLWRNWNSPDILYAHVAQGLHDGFATEVLAAAEHLALQDPDRERGLLVLVRAHLQLHQFAKARVAAEAALWELPRSLPLIESLIEALAGMNDKISGVEMLEALNCSLQIDPNQPMVMQRYIDLLDGRTGVASAIAVYNEFAKLPGAWLPQWHLGKIAFEDDRVDEGVALYAQVLACISSAPQDVFGNIAETLASVLPAAQLIELLEPRFRLADHGLSGAAPLLKAYWDSGQLKKGLKLLRDMQPWQEPAWATVQDYWEGEFAKLKPPAVVQEQTPVHVDMGEANTEPDWEHLAPMAPIEDETAVPMTFLTLDRPLWVDPAAYLATWALSGHGKTVVFMGASVEAHGLAEANEVERAEIGLICRSGTLQLAQGLAFCTNAVVNTCLPVSQGAWPLLEKPLGVRDAPKTENLPAAMAFARLDTTVQPWRYEVMLMDPETGEMFGTVTEDLPADNPAAGIGSLSKQVVQLAVSSLDLERVILPAWAESVSYEWEWGALCAQHDALDVYAAPRDGRQGTVEIDEMFERMLSMCENNLAHAASALLYGQSLQRLKDKWPGPVQSCKRRTRMLFKKLQLDAQSMAEFQRVCMSVYPVQAKLGQ